MFGGIRKSISRSFEYFTRNLYRTTMEEEDSIVYSHQKLQILTSVNGNKDAAVKEYLKKVDYPPVKDFPKGLDWFNVSEPLSFSNHLKGKIVLFDFFTYCCINCMHILPVLRDLENEFSVEDGLVVIGVHSAKFENEKVSNNILAAIQRYGITHPVVNDHKMTTWKNCGVYCWPTLLLFGPNANPLVMLLGEGHKEDLQLYIKNALEHYKAKNEISNHKLPLKSAHHYLLGRKGPLLFPGKIANSKDSNEELFAVSDSGNHRILIFRSDGSSVKQIGSGCPGFQDGNFRDAEFNSPQGLTFENGTTLFVADTENHAVRKINLKNETVETVVGTGVQGKDKKGGRAGKQQEISSPWDIALYHMTDPNANTNPKKVLIIAMAGTHQIWAWFLEDTTWWKNETYRAGTCVCIAGSGREENKNNQYPHTAGFAQPSGLAISNGRKEVYIADSESSSVRRLSLADGKVTPVVGGDKNPKNLFAFGDKDGQLQEAKLQHLLGVTLANNSDILFVADTYNHKLKKVDITTNTSYTLSVSGLNEPGGLTCSVNDKKLFVADTNNHCIKIVTLDDKFSATSVENLELKMDAAAVAPGGPKQNLVTVDSKAMTINKDGGQLKMKINLNFAKGLKLNPEATQKWMVKTPNTAWSIAPNSGNNINNIDIVCKVPPLSTDNNNLECVFNLVTCTEEICIPKKFVIRQPVVFERGAPSMLERVVNIELDPADVTLREN